MVSVELFQVALVKFEISLYAPPNEIPLLEYMFVQFSGRKINFCKASKKYCSINHLLILDGLHLWQIKQKRQCKLLEFRYYDPAVLRACIIHSVGHKI